MMTCVSAFVCILIVLFATNCSSPNYFNTKGTSINLIKNSSNVKWTRNSNCNYYMTELLKDIINDNNLQFTEKDDYILYLPCTYNFVNYEINKTNPTNKEQRFFIIDGCDELTSKSLIWKHLFNKYGGYASTYMPKTYLTTNKDDLVKFSNDFTNNKIYIMKKNIQRQEGLKITNKKKDVLTGARDGFIIAQELLQDPYIINKRKTNMRFYLLLVCQNGFMEAYVHNEGFVYYTKVPFVKNTTDWDPNITTGYIDRKVYESNPLTLGDFKQYLDKKRDLLPSEIQLKTKGILSDLVFQRIYWVISQLIDAIRNDVGQGSKLRPYVTFQLFGVDIAINDNLHPQIMEVNKGPDMSAKDKRDKAIKYSVMSDIFKVVDVLKGNHDFIKIWSGNNSLVNNI